MQIALLDFVSGARQARGIAVIIDVFRAFSVAAYAFAGGAKRMVPVGSIETALELKAQHPEYLSVGERHARRLPGFDAGNSPYEIAQLDLRDRTLIHTTHAGTQGLVNATLADEVLTGALVNAAAVARYIRARQPRQVSLVRMGHEARERCAEDDLCAELIAAHLRGDSPDTSDAAVRLRSAPAAVMFFDPACTWAPQADFDLCTAVDRFDFVLRLDRATSPATLERI